MPLSLEALPFELRTLANAGHMRVLRGISHEFKLQGTGINLLKKYALMESIALI
jgi:hypothetical protein